MPFPAHWGNDELTKHLDSVREHQFATYANKVPASGNIVELDKCFWRLLNNSVYEPDDMVAVFLMFRAHSAYRAASSCAFAGQFVELQPLLRLMLECGGYAFLIDRNPKLAKVWLNRRESAAARREVKQQFNSQAVRKSLASSDEHLKNVFGELYERTIDFGAHPNEMSVTSGITIEGKDEKGNFDLIYLHGDGVALDYSLKFTAQVGVCVLLIFQEIFQERFELLGISSELAQLRRKL